MFIRPIDQEASRRLTLAALSLLLLVLAGSFNATATNSDHISLATKSIFSDAGLAGERGFFFAQSRFWLFYPSGYYVKTVPFIVVDVYYVTSSDGLDWTSPVGLGISSNDFSGIGLTHDENHVYVGFATSRAIFFAFGQLNSNGTVSMNMDGGLLKVAVPEGSSGGVTLSVGVSSNLHVFIAYQAVYGCGLCVTDSSAAPYTSWNVSLRIDQRVNYPKIHPYGPGKIILVSGDYTNVWDKGWGTPILLSGNDGVGGEQILYLKGSAYLFGLGVDCLSPGPGGCIGYSIFEGNTWSTVQPTNIRKLYGGFSVTYDRQGDSFLVYTFNINPFNSTIVYQWSAKIGSNFYQNTAVAAGRNGLYAITSLETSVSRGLNVGSVGAAWTETGSFPYRIYAFTQN